ncbi:malto-oligosyltrehalose synthase [Streptomyces boncukensis]|uniref:Malto-oligosyltrehalose synthase n=1 Tax=Streptomyces boncukensis TaxID=2711219 RepID=A0A6G4WSM2_9ACTN|nr:malto-oligosyltrehalose synthase [Streptomyces boncukensis]NGO68266.1 malto-oligosyltrehalose synthase [Streptomyces boncukensis]
MRSAAPPTATYRLQLQPDFPFAAAERAVSRIAGLGVSHLQLSPVLTAVPGSAHGYDVTDHGTVRAELGGERGLRALADAARAHGLGLVLDIVPNHMAVPADLRLNAPLWETLREGPGSPWAHWFDIDWAAGGGRMLLPVLAGRLHEELPRMRVRDGTLRYGERVLPLREGTERLPLPELCEAQHYRLSWWRLGRTELNYRRFLTVSELIALRVEDPEVFGATHAKVLQLVREGVVDGLRVDHPDGLADPYAYLLRLREATAGRWTVVEKILAPDAGEQPGTAEALPECWPVAGTTGYDALRHVDGLFADPEGCRELAALYREFTGAAADEGGDWAATVRRAAYRAAVHELAAEVERLRRLAAHLCATAPGPAGRALRDHAPWALRTALRELLVRLPVYRPYASPGAPPRAADAALLDRAAEGARGAFRVPEEAAAVDAVRDFALGLPGGPRSAEFAARFAQVSSALRAKAVEDTACYRYTPLLSACEVGGAPDRPAVSPGEFHAFCARTQRDWPTTATALSTHDTKRSADVRAAIAVLSESPEGWEAVLRASRAGACEAGDVPLDPHTVWTFWQTAFGMGTVPPPVERLRPAVLKAVREAGLRTSWTEPDGAYEAAVQRYVDAAAHSPGAAALGALLRELAPYVRANVLGMALLHLTMPGVPDLYQGTERTYRALVDPDNRAPVTWAAPVPPEGPAAEKQRVTTAALRLRARHPEWFLDSSWYEPAAARGDAAGHCVAYVRSGAVLTAVTRLARGLEEAGGWRDTRLELPAGGWRDLLARRPEAAVLREGRCRLADLFADLPVALLVRAGGPSDGPPSEGPPAVPFGSPPGPPGPRPQE